MLCSLYRGEDRLVRDCQSSEAAQLCEQSIQDHLTGFWFHFTANWQNAQRLIFTTVGPRRPWTISSHWCQGPSSSSAPQWVKEPRTKEFTKTQTIKIQCEKNKMSGKSRSSKHHFVWIGIYLIVLYVTWGFLKYWGVGGWGVSCGEAICKLSGSLSWGTNFWDHTQPLDIVGLQKDMVCIQFENLNFFFFFT